MWLRRLAAVTVGLASMAAHAAPGLIYDGNALPAAQGWQRVAQGNSTEVALGAGLAQFTTTTALGAHSGGQQLYQYTTSASNFIASIRLRAISVNPHNQLDSALTFSLSDGNFLPVGNGSQRSNMLAIDAARVLWADEIGGFANSDATQFHEYAMRYRNGRLDVYIDASYAAIAAGTATPVLTRNLPPYTSPGVIVFGDQTNDSNVDSNFVVDFVKFQNLDIIDPPSASVTPVPTMHEWGRLLLSLLLAAAAFGALRLRKRS